MRGGLLAGPLPRPDPSLRIDAKGIRHAVDVVEVPHDLHGIEDGFVAEPGAAQRVDVGLGHRVRLLGELHGKDAERGVGRRKAGGSPVGSDPPSELVGRNVIRQSEIPSDLGPEVVRVGANSVAAAVGAGHHDREHFALPSGKRRSAEHDRPVERQGRLER